MHKLSRYNLTVPLDDGRSILANTLHQRAIYLESNELQSVQKVDVEPAAVNETLFQELCGLGMLVPADLNEREIVVGAHRRERTESDILQLTIATTLGCNLKCAYCLESEKAPVHLTQDDEDRILKFVRRQLDGKRMMQVVWFGGEPLLNKDSIARLSHKFIQLCTLSGVAYGASLITNGALLTTETAVELRRLQVRDVRITIDGPREIHDRLRPTVGRGSSYEKALDGLRVSAATFDTALGINLSKENASEVVGLLRQLAHEKLQDITILLAPIVPLGLAESRTNLFTMRDFAREEVKLLSMAKELGFHVATGFEQQNALPCSAVNPEHYAIEPRGNVKRCYAEIASGTQSAGTLRDGLFVESGGETQWRDYDGIDDECSECQFLPMCYGGCPKLRMNGQPKEDVICTPRRYNLEGLLKLHADAHRPAGTR